MPREVPFSDCSSVLGEIEYPAGRAAAAEEFSDVALRLADGTVNLGGLISEINNETFESVEDLETDLHNVLPREAVGEPYQSEGDA